MTFERNDKKEPKIIRISEIKNASLLNKLLKEHGEIIVKNPTGPDIKVTFMNY